MTTITKSPVESTSDKSAYNKDFFEVKIFSSNIIHLLFNEEDNAIIKFMHILNLLIPLSLSVILFLSVVTLHASTIYPNG